MVVVVATEGVDVAPSQADAILVVEDLRSVDQK